MDLSKIGLDLDIKEKEVLYNLDKNSELYQQYKEVNFLFRKGLKMWPWMEIIQFKY